MRPDVDLDDSTPTERGRGMLLPNESEVMIGRELSSDAIIESAVAEGTVGR